LEKVSTLAGTVILYIPSENLTIQNWFQSQAFEIIVAELDKKKKMKENKWKMVALRLSLV